LRGESTMKIGTVFDQTSTNEFLVMLDQEVDNERLLFSYVEVTAENQEPIIARISSVHKENPLLNRDQAVISHELGLGYELSRRFTQGWAKCIVIGSLTANGYLDMNRRVVAPNSEVKTPSEQTLRLLFFRKEPYYIPVGTIDTFSDQAEQVPVTLNADELVTKHFCIFGMTGSGKTNTAAKIIEELMMRGHRMIIFDSHDDYANLDDFSNLFKDISSQGEEVRYSSPIEHGQMVNLAMQQISTPLSDDEKERLYQHLISAFSIIYNNEPCRSFLIKDSQSKPKKEIDTTQPQFAQFIQTLFGSQPWRDLITQERMLSLNIFPELKNYGQGFEDFTINIMSASLNEEFSLAQWRWLSQEISQAQGYGIPFLRHLHQQTQSIQNNSQRDATQQKLQALIGIYHDLLRTQCQPYDVESLFNQICSRSTNQLQTVYRVSLTALPSNIRKALVYAIVTYFFRSFKFRNYTATGRSEQPANAYPVLFVLEEARSLIPKSSGDGDTDHAGKLARRAMRDLAYEARKFSLGYGIISQKPATVDPEVVSQCNTFILHKLASPEDQDYVKAVTENLSKEDLDLVKVLATGQALVSGTAIKSTSLVRMSFRYSQEGIPAPTPIKDSLQSSTQAIRNILGI